MALTALSRWKGDGEVFEPLPDPEFFKQVSIDEFGAVCWPNGADLAPDHLYE